MAELVEEVHVAKEFKSKKEAKKPKKDKKEKPLSNYQLSKH